MAAGSTGWFWYGLGVPWRFFVRIFRLLVGGTSLALTYALRQTGSDKSQGEEDSGRPGGLRQVRMGMGFEDEEQGVREEEQGVRDEEQGVRDEEQGVREEEQGVREEEQGVRDEEQGVREEEQGVRDEEQGVRDEEQGLQDEEQGVRDEEQGVQKEEQGVREEEQVVRKEEQGVREEEQGVREEEQGVRDEEQGVREEEQGVREEEQGVRDEEQGVREEEQGVREEEQGVRDEEQGVRDEEQGVREEEQGVRDEEQGVRDEEQGLQDEEQGVRDEEQGVQKEDQGVREEEQVVRKEEQGVREEEQGVREEEQGVRDEEQGVREEEQGVRDEEQGVREEEQGVREEEQGVRDEEQGVRDEEQGVRDEEQGVRKEEQGVREEEQGVREEEQVVRKEEQGVREEEQGVREEEQGVRDEEQGVRDDDEEDEEYGVDSTDELFCKYDSTWENEDQQEPLDRTEPKTRSRSYKFRRFENAAKDMQNYRHDYPFQFHRWGNKEPNGKPNLQFYLGQSPSLPDGVYIDDFHSKWFGKYETLERVHSYIQWLFPLQEPGMNYQASVLTAEEIQEFCQNTTAKENLLKSYKLMLDFYGIELWNEETGEVRRASNWKDRFRNLNSHSHNNLRITRILKCLGILGYPQYQKPLVQFYLQETLVHRQLDNVKESVLNYFIFAVRDKKERRKLLKFAYMNSDPKEDFVWCPKKVQKKWSHYNETLPVPNLTSCGSWT